MTQTDVSQETQLPRGADTRERILDAAERLFAENGFQNTSLRQITAEAHVNLAAINYHFQSKEQLISAVLHRLIEPINKRRLQILDALEGAASGKPLKLESLLRAFLLPVFEARDNHPRAAEIPKLYARLHSEPGDMVAKAFLPVVSPILVRFRPAFQLSLPTLPASELGWCMHFTIGAMGHTLTSPQTLALLTQGDSTVEGWPELLDRLITFCAAGIRAAARAKAAQGAD
jgi:AcrR family transcriptional regulator